MDFEMCNTNKWKWTISKFSSLEIKAAENNFDREREKVAGKLSKVERREEKKKWWKLTILT